MKVTPITDQDKSNLKAAYQQALDNLALVESVSTQAEALAAVKMLARNQTKILKVLRNLIA